MKRLKRQAAMEKIKLYPKEIQNKTEESAVLETLFNPIYTTIFFCI